MYRQFVIVALAVALAGCVQQGGIQFECRQLGGCGPLSVIFNAIFLTH